MAENFVVERFAYLEPGYKTVAIYILGKETVTEQKRNTSNSSKLKTKLESIYAWQAAESYGKGQYPYGFKLHYFAKQYAQTAEDENTWFLKAGCTVTNAFGQKAELTCEARVSGTNDDHRIPDSWHLLTDIFL